MLLPFISHSFLGFLKSSVRLDVAARSRVVYDVAARQERGARVPVIRGPPAHRIGAAVLRLTAIVVADLELRLFKAPLRVHARGHAWQTHYETRASERPIGERLGKHMLTREGIHAVVDRHVPGELERLIVD